MRIALLGPLDHPLAEPYAGGLERHTAQLAAGLAGAGHAVSLFALPGSEQAPGVRLVPSTQGYRQVIASIRKGGFDLFHNNAARREPTLLSLTLSLPVVTTLHTPPYRGLALAAILARLRKRHHYVAISAFCADQWRRFCGTSHIIHNGIELNAWPFSPDPEPDKLVWSGRLSPEKGAEYAIETATAAGCRLDLAGPIFDPDYFAAKVAPRLSDRIQYRGHLSGGALAELYGTATAGLFTSVWDEPFGLVIPEMLACGTPVVGFRSGAAGELLPTSLGTLVDKYDVPALAASLKAIKGIPRLRCRTHAAQHFGMDGMVSAYLRLYTKVVGTT